MAQGTGDSSRTVEDRGVSFDSARLGDANGSDLADSAKVVALEVDDHVELGLILHAVAKFPVHAALAWAGSLDWPRFDANRTIEDVGAEEEFGRVGDDGEFAIVEQGGVPRRKQTLDSVIERERREVGAR